MAKKQPPEQFSYAQLLGFDPVLQAALSQAQIEGAQQQQALTAARRQALIAYGAIPESGLGGALTGNIAGDIDPATRELAKEATDAGLSTVGQLAHNYKQTQEGTLGGLYARGSLRSGSYGRLSGENLQGYQTASAQAQEQLLGNLAGLWSGFEQSQQGLAAGAQTATSDALSRILQQVGSGLIAAPSGAPGGPAGGGSGSIGGALGPHASTPVTVGSTTSLEPHATAANYATPTAAMATPHPTVGQPQLQTLHGNGVGGALAPRRRPARPPIYGHNPLQ